MLFSVFDSNPFQKIRWIQTSTTIAEAVLLYIGLYRVSRHTEVGVSHVWRLVTGFLVIGIGISEG